MKKGKLIVLSAPSGTGKTTISIELLKRSNIEISGSNVAVIGRSRIVGEPLSRLLLKENATVTISLPDDVTIGDDLTVTGDIGATNMTLSGNLTVQGSTTTVSSSTLQVTDGAVKVSKDNAANATDFGLYGQYVESSTTKYAGLLWDASESSKFRLFHGNQSEPTTLSLIHI